MRDDKRKREREREINDQINVPEIILIKSIIQVSSLFKLHPNGADCIA
jgi:hypothetical protein